MDAFCYSQHVLNTCGHLKKQKQRGEEFDSTWPREPYEPNLVIRVPTSTHVPSVERRIKRPDLFCARRFYLLSSSLLFALAVGLGIALQPIPPPPRFQLRVLMHFTQVVTANFSSASATQCHRSSIEPYQFISGYYARDICCRWRCVVEQQKLAAGRTSCLSVTGRV